LVSNGLTINKLLDILNDFSPFSLAESWDNVGLMIGDQEDKVSGIIIGLDPGFALLEEAVSQGINTVITHHPLIFHPLKSIRLNSPEGKLIQTAINNHLNIISSHTNLDITSGGINDLLANKFGLKNTKPLSERYLKNRKPSRAETESIGFGRIGDFQEPVAWQKFLAMVLEILKTDSIKYAGKIPTLVKRLGLCGGSGSDFTETALDEGAQVYLSGEFKHSTARWAEMAGICLIDAGHFATENLISEHLVSCLSTELKNSGVDLKIQESKKTREPWTTFIN
jgi:dinuclear metal center YbgI/SA1388 family protein